jgi:dsRNA-specific ribonuclease
MDLTQYVPWLLGGAASLWALAREVALHRIKRAETVEDKSDERGWGRVAKLESDVAFMRKKLERMTMREALIVAFYARRENRIITAFELALLAPMLPDSERADTLKRSRALVTEALATVFADDQEEADAKAP